MRTQPPSPLTPTLRSIMRQVMVLMWSALVLILTTHSEASEGVRENVTVGTGSLHPPASQNHGDDTSSVVGGKGGCPGSSLL